VFCGVQIARIEFEGNGAFAWPETVRKVVGFIDLRIIRLSFTKTRIEL